MLWSGEMETFHIGHPFHIGRQVQPMGGSSPPPIRGYYFCIVMGMLYMKSFLDPLFRGTSKALVVIFRQSVMFEVNILEHSSSTEAEGLSFRSILLLWNGYFLLSRVEVPLLLLLLLRRREWCWIWVPWRCFFDNVVGLFGIEFPFFIYQLRKKTPVNKVI